MQGHTGFRWAPRLRTARRLCGAVAVAVVALAASGARIGAAPPYAAQPRTTQPATPAPTGATPLTCRPSDEACQQHLALIDGMASAEVVGCPSGAPPIVQKLLAGEVRSCLPIPRPGPALPPGEVPAFLRVVGDVQNVVGQLSSQGVVWRGPALTECAQRQACGGAYLRSPTASIVAPSDHVRRSFAVALTRALADTGAQEVIITVAPDVTSRMDESCSDIKGDPRCWGEKTISPWRKVGQMPIELAQVHGMNLDLLSGTQIDALYGWSQA